MIKKEVLIGLFTLLLLAAIGWLWLSPGGFSTAPEVTFKTIDGRQITLRELQGRPVLVTFWATSCPGCIKEMPHLISLYNELSTNGLEIIGVAMSYDPPNQVLELSQRRQIPYPVALDVDGAIARLFGNVMLTPTSFLISPTGKIVRHKIGEMNMEKLREQIENMLSQQQLATSHKPLVANSL